ncbi:P-loop containing nucleoside triphosphate hydrolase protein [Gigaspora margarita]|uniref:P-loop containing nucleoside triphosphate hydrolase protein n=1 Tax=Gigaspora margarita TaxID=4874 RepID=A0A8H4ALC2_GIGMA|nr:P-loop containing nucleoside triphosphate hydrolase protein [Gigaspora margarita]
MYDSKWLDENYPKDGGCKYKGDIYGNIGKRRKEITHLDISCHHGNALNKIRGGIDLRDFINLVMLRCRNNKLTDLAINNLKMLEEIDCSDNELRYLEFENFPYLRKINCSINKNLKLKLKNCSSLKTLDCPSDGLNLHITDCYNITVRYFSGDSVINTLYLNDVDQDGIDKIESLKRENDQLKQIITELEESPIINKKNVLIIGRTGSGKSALANNLVNEYGNFEEIFKEDEFSESVTTQLQVEEIMINGINYRIIDTVGFGDTGTVTGDEAVLEAVKATYAVREGVNQILFVVRGRNDIDEKVMKLYNSLKDEIFGEKIYKYTTIVRTNFGSFTEDERCEEEIKALKQNKLISQLANSCNRIILIDNPSLKGQPDTIIEHNRKSRSESRQILVNHLSTCENVYRPRKLKEVVSKFDHELNNTGVDNKQLIKPNFKTARLDLIVNAAIKCIPTVVTIVHAVAVGSSCQIT